MSKTINKMKKETSRTIEKIWRFVSWLTGILVSLAVGFGMANGVLNIPLLSDFGAGIIVIYAGWVVVFLTILTVILRIIDILSR